MSAWLASGGSTAHEIASMPDLIGISRNQPCFTQMRGSSDHSVLKAATDGVWKMVELKAVTKTLAWGKLVEAGRPEKTTSRKDEAGAC